jgi:hypothetical protein
MGPNLIYSFPYTHNFVTEERLAELKKDGIPWLMGWKEWQLSNMLMVSVDIWVVHAGGDYVSMESDRPGRIYMEQALEIQILMGFVEKFQSEVDKVWTNPN